MRVLHSRREPSPPCPGRGFVVAVVCGVIALGCDVMAARSVARAADAAGRAADEQAIRATARAYREALAMGDTAAIAALWTADADIVDGYGAVVPAAAAALGGGADAGPRPQVTLGETRLRFVSPDVAIEDGTVDVTPAGAAHPIEGWFTAIWVRQNGTWKVAGLREAERPVVEGPASIDDLGWMVGEWEAVAAEGDDAAARMRMSVAWDATRAFLLRDLRVPTTGDDEPAEVLVHQRIGWDPVLKRIRSWTFLPDGGVAEATWARDGGSWVARGVATMPDGTQAASVTISTFDGPDRFTWRTLPDSIDDDAPKAVTWVRRATAGEKR